MNRIARTLAALGAAGLVAAWAPPASAGDDCSQPEDECAPLPPLPPTPPPEPRPAPRMMVPRPPRQVITYAEQSPNGDLISGGALMFGISYGTSVLIGAGSDRPSDQQLFVPLAGPWMALASRSTCSGPYECGISDTTSKVLLAADGIFQAAGALQIAAGFLFPQTTIVTRTIPHSRVSVTPTVSPHSVGLTASGSF